MKKYKYIEKILKCINIYNKNYIENIFLKFLKNKSIVKKEWKFFFKNLFNNKNKKKNIIKKYDIKNLIFNFRSYGHIIAKTNPIKKEKKNIKKFLYFKKKYKILIKKNNIKKKIELDYIKIYKKMKKIYTNSIGIEYMHMEIQKEKNWIKNYIEKKNKNKFSNKNRKKLLKDLIKTNYFEKYLNFKFSGSKRFSLEGSEIILPMIKEIIKNSKKNNINRIILGMAHRGRINVLRNIFKKPLEKIFSEFDDIKLNKKNKIDDVKYHLGYKRKIFIKNEKIYLEIKNNPSHLESIYPVVLGSSKFYLEENLKKKNRKNILSLLIHGDASISGQGIIQETLNMSRTKGFKTNGSIHIIINNQIGFTTSKISEMRSSKYCTDISKMISCPIFHINADFPEKAIFVINLAMKFLNKFKKDVFIDVISYRKYGHHESDDPSATQPHMYNIIRKHLPSYKIYEKKLIKKNKISLLNIKKIKKKYNILLEKRYNKYKKLYIKNCKKNFIKKNKKKKYIKKNKINFSELKKISIKINTIPKNINLHKIVKKIYDNRILMSKEKIKFDWSAAEALSIATLLKKGISCRMSGEDVARGTFFQRHAIIYDQIKKNYYIPLSNLTKKSNFSIWNSSLSEESVLAFEYGYSVSSKKVINIWEAQFGDFVNSAQVIIDQFISSGKKKWGEKCKLIIMLPHGYEGQGPEHSSSRLERFLQLSSENNFQIVCPTNSSQIYHIIHNQIYSKNICPLIIMSPKSMLRDCRSFSSLKEIYLNKFKSIIYKKKKCYKNIEKMIFCSGKIYYELKDMIKKNNIKRILLIRIERLYPFPKKKIKKILNLCKNSKNFIWSQEEPKNQGAWYFIKNNIETMIPKTFLLKCISRKSSSSTATGYMKTHKKEQEKIIKDSLY
ncbi:2-oxoglutarate dehydrogenase E1 component [Buchnera aphidicola (Ceratovacuna keduensis)]|uniref:2-oxoglutarate dehydrogenase E1 component n=1 Tax=Buchnera aphidicola TaxID=9 RepID=UPI0031B8A0B3